MEETEIINKWEKTGFITNDFENKRALALAFEFISDYILNDVIGIKYKNTQMGTIILPAICRIFRRIEPDELSKLPDADIKEIVISVLEPLDNFYNDVIKDCHSSYIDVEAEGVALFCDNFTHPLITKFKTN